MDSTTDKYAEIVNDGKILTLLKKHGLNLILLTSVWSLGYFRFSAVWLLMVVAVGLWRERASSRMNQTRELARKVMNNERESITSVVGDLPSWVYFPDTERAEWLNKIVKQMWPYVEGYVVDMLHNTVEPAVKENLPKPFKNFRFETISLGRYPPRIGGVKVYTDNIGRDEVIMDLEIFYAGDCEIELSVKTIKRVKAGIKDIQLHGMIRVEMRPLVRKIPLVGGLSIYFLKRPALDFNLTNLANVFDVPGLSDLLHGVIEDQLATFLVLPNRISVPLMDTTSIIDLKYPLPSGILRIEVVEAKNLVKADIGILKRGKSDPYAIITVGTQKFKTKVIKNSVNPVWKYHSEAIVYEVFGQSLDIDVLDEDTGDKDDPLGSVSLDIFHLSKLGQFDSWLPLEDIKHGDIHLRLSWLVLSDDSCLLNQESSVDENFKPTDYSPAILVVKLDSAKELPIGRKSASMPSPSCILSVGQTTQKSLVQNNTNAPVWEEMFTFFIKRPFLQTLDIQIFDSKKEQSLGSLCIPIKELTNKPGMSLERPYKLENSGAHSQLSLKLSLKTLKETSSYVASDVDLKELLLSDQRTEKPETEADGVKPETEAASTEVVPTVEAEAQTKPTSDKESAEHSFHDNHTEEVIPSENSSRVNSQTELRNRKAEPKKKSSVNGKLQLTLQFVAEKKELSVTIHKVVGLPLEDEHHPPDPYIRLYLLPDKGKSGKRKTRVVKEAQDVDFDEKFEFHCNASELSSRSLDIVVKNDSSFLALSNPSLGQLNLSLGPLQLDSAGPVTDWYDLDDANEDAHSHSEH